MTTVEEKEEEEWRRRARSRTRRRKWTRRECLKETYSIIKVEGWKKKRGEKGTNTIKMMPRARTRTRKGKRKNTQRIHVENRPAAPHSNTITHQNHKGKEITPKEESRLD
jgi:hypothetical protein